MYYRCSITVHVQLLTLIFLITIEKVFGLFFSHIIILSIFCQRFVCIFLTVATPRCYRPVPHLSLVVATYVSMWITISRESKQDHRNFDKCQVRHQKCFIETKMMYKKPLNWGIWCSTPLVNTNGKTKNTFGHLYGTTGKRTLHQYSLMFPACEWSKGPRRQCYQDI